MRLTDLSIARARRPGTPRGLRVAVAVAVAVAVIGVASCSSGGGKASLTAVSQQYESAVDPAHAALNTTISQALAYGGGPAASLDASVPGTASAVRRSAGRLRGISAPNPVKTDIADVAKAMDVVGTDLNSLQAARGDDVRTAIAQLIADSGREMAADNLVRLALAESPTAASTPPAVPAVADVSTTAVEAPTTAETTPPTTAARPVATVPRAATTTARASTTVAKTATTTKTP